MGSVVAKGWSKGNPLKPLKHCYQSITPSRFHSLQNGKKVSTR